MSLSVAGLSIWKEVLCPERLNFCLEPEVALVVYFDAVYGNSKVSLNPVEKFGIRYPDMTAVGIFAWSWHVALSQFFIGHGDAPLCSLMLT